MSICRRKRSSQSSCNLLASSPFKVQKSGSGAVSTLEVWEPLCRPMDLLAFHPDHFKPFGGFRGQLRSRSGKTPRPKLRGYRPQDGSSNGAAESFRIILFVSCMIRHCACRWLGCWVGQPLALFCQRQMLSVLEMLQLFLQLAVDLGLGDRRILNLAPQLSQVGLKNTTHAIHLHFGFSLRYLHVFTSSNGFFLQLLVRVLLANVELLTPVRRCWHVRKTARSM